jgi:4-hydroxy-tetrahydrodipicolinate synthase
VAGIRQLVDNWQSDDADALQARITAVRMAIQAFPLVPALKALMARFHETPEWRRVAPPLMPLGEDETRALFAKLASIDFAMATLGSVAAGSGDLNG